MIKKLITTLILTVGLAHAQDAYQVCGKNSQTKVIACSPTPLEKAVADANTAYLNDSMKENGLYPVIKFYSQKFQLKNLSNTPSILYPGQPAKPSAPATPVVTPQVDQKG